MSRIVVGPFNRVEGDLEVTLDIQGDKVTSAKVNSPLYRGFERILLGQDPMDALVYTPRICGICSVTQSVACARALADLMQVKPPMNGELCTSLILANENMTDLLTHFYLFFMPDFARDTYATMPWFDDIQGRFKATSGSATKVMLPARADFLHMMGMMAGKWPHTLTIQPGGSSRSLQASERLRILAIITAFRQFLETQLFGDNLAVIASLASVSDLQQWQSQKSWNHSDFTRFLHISDSLDLASLGRATDRFLSFGAYQGLTTEGFISGVSSNSKVVALEPAMITEDHSFSWLSPSSAPLHPSEGVTQPTLDNKNAYSWCKAPRLQGNVAEVGALARQVVNQHPLAVDLVRQGGGNVHSRVIARLLELALVVPQMQQWVKDIDPAAPFNHHVKMPSEGKGVGMVEAARGALGHWMEIHQGKIIQYQIVAPTSWNFSPRDGNQVPGALEQALQGAPVRPNEETPVAVQHIVRSFDPCMACTVH